MRILKLLTSFLLIYSLNSVAKKDESTSFVVEMIANNVEERSQIANEIHIDSIENDRIFSVVSADEMQRLYKMHSEKIITTSVLNENAVKDFSFLAATMDFPSRDEKFHTYDEMYEDLKALESEYPDLASVFSIGKSVLGKDIWGIKISGKRSEAEELVPAIAYLGTHHAREHLSTEMPIMLAQKLLDEYHLDGNIKNLIDGNEVYIIPMVNPDGAMYDIEGGRYKSWRKNRRSNANGSYGVDLNRNYGYGWGTGGSSSNPYSEVYMGESAFSEPETQAVKEFFLAHENITIALSFHTFSELILYPWGGLYEGVGGEDEAIFKKMATDMAQMNHYDPMQSSELYIASGDTCDWLYGELNVFCFTFELSPSSIWGGGFYPGASVIDTVFDDNWEPILYLLDRAADPRSALDL